MYLVDIGNTNAHIYDGKEVKNLPYREFLQNYLEEKVYYINVNPNIKDELLQNDNWINLEPFIKLEGAYSSMGIDRKVLLKAYDSGLFIDAGSAITIDLKSDGTFIGGTILPGIWHIKQCYKDISNVLEIDTLEDVNLSKLPNSSTRITISYGIIAPIVALVDKINHKNLPIYCCGGDGELLAKYLNAKYDKYLLFKGMQRVIKESFNVNNCFAKG